MFGIKKNYTILIALLLFLYSNTYGQSLAISLVKDDCELTYLDIENPIFIEGIHSDNDITTLKRFAAQNATESIFLEWSEGKQGHFTPLPSHTLHPSLNKRFPNIICGKGVDLKTGAILYFDYNSFLGFRAVVIEQGNRWYIDPSTATPNAPRVVYQKNQLNKHAAWECGVEDDYELTESHIESTGNIFVENELNKYRLAVSTTPNYANFHGGTIASTMAAITTTVNRVNSVYEMDAGITLELVAENDQLIFLNPASSPYNNNSATQIIGVSTSVINNIIGFNSYDIGHVFSTGAGGLAGLFSVCSNNKARGVTGLANPVGDPYDIDYVAHEIGHQFGATHTQNNTCNRTASSAFEPFSASTIMGYAGICAPNLQNQSDDYFHHHSLRQINNFAFLGAGNGCATKVNTGNSAPQITSELANHYIPVETPFFLTASVTDPEGDPWTLVWEQYDLGPSGQSQTFDRGPIYRSFSPEQDGVRYLPLKRSVALGSNIIGERLTFDERRLTFRATARDNNPNGSAVSWIQERIDVVGNEPFEVVSPNQQTPFFSNALNLIQWDTANTTISPIDCQFLDVYLSVDNARSFPQKLGTIPNTGSGLIFIPQSVGAVPNARLMLKAKDGIFYNLSQSFSILDKGLQAVYSDEQNETTIYPNPASDIIYIEHLPENGAHATIVDVSGRTIATHRFTKQNETITVSLLSSGVYTFIITDLYKKPHSTHKLIVK